MSDYSDPYRLPDIPISALVDTYWSSTRQTTVLSETNANLRSQIEGLEAEIEALRAEIATLSLPKTKVKKAPVMRRCEGRVPYSTERCPVRFKPKTPRRKYCSERCALRESTRRYHERQLAAAQ